MNAVITEAEDLRARLSRAVDEDAASYNAILQAYKLPRETEAEQANRSKAVQDATLYASQVPLQTAQDALRVMALALKVMRAGNINAISDGAAGALMGRAALTAAGYNVRINVTMLNDAAQADSLLAELKEIEAKAVELEAAIQPIMVERGGLKR
jgi:formiminotetrahydrofolate cyclodeaminase